MAYPDEFYRQRQANGEEMAGKNLQEDVREDAVVNRSERFVYGVVGVMMILVLTRIVLRLFTLDETAIGTIVHGLTDPYVWIFNSLFNSNPDLLMASVEPGSIVSLVFFPLFGWAVLGLVSEARKSVYYRISRSK